MFPADTKILVVDDMMTIRKLVKKALSEMGHINTTEAENGATAFEKFVTAQSENVPFKLVICDWNMPAMTGIELLGKIRGLAKGGTTPFVLLTAETEKSLVQEAITLKVNGYIVKPFNTEALSKKLEEVHARTQRAKAA